MSRNKDITIINTMSLETIMGNGINEHINQE